MEKNNVFGVFGVIVVMLLGFLIFHLVNGSCIVLEKHEQKYEVIDINPPKHFSLTLKNVDTGEIFDSVAISKRCQYWENLKMNSVVTFEEETFKYEKRDHEQRQVNVNYDFCESLKK